MGKDLKGKELGAGIVQRQDKRYVARYISKISGKRVEKYFYKINEAKKWLAEAKYEDEHNKKCIVSTKRSHNYKQYALILQTGLRTGEMIGLTWNSIDFENHFS